MYNLEFTSIARKEIEKLKRSEPQVFKKLGKLFEELQEHPEIGTGHPKPLGSNRVGQWSRRITDKHRLVYSINDEEITILIISVAGHYDDK